MSRGEEAAAVLIRQDGDLVAAKRPRLLNDLLLVAADQGAEDRHSNRLLDHRKVVQCLGGHLPQAFPCHQGLGTLSPRDLRRDPHHESPVEHHAQRSRRLGDDLPLHFAERDKIESREMLESCKALDEIRRLLARGAVLKRMAVEVDEDGMAAPLHQPVRRNRGVDPARKQHHDAAAHPDREAARSRLAAKGEVDLPGQDFDVQRHLGVFQVHPRPRPTLHGGAQLPVDLLRLQRERLVRPARRHLERFEVSPFQRAIHAGLQGVHVRLCPLRQREVGDTEDAPHPLADRRPIRVLGKRQDKPPRPLVRPADPRPRRRTQEIRRKPPQEERLVLALETDLVVVHHHVAHTHS